MAGIFFKYDMSPLMVEVQETRRSLWQFLIRLCGIVGGIFATSGMLNSFVGSLTDGERSGVIVGEQERANLVVATGRFFYLYDVHDNYIGNTLKSGK